ncbi:hypothetical protein EDC56_2839 [Sinobacterium caligoides]|uniref:Serine aminopeptidase S33 domain-containing protein n=2 Tax=Sinobacterium caligoides TaxID=933926 RepID=A0A3N2DK64_9GAMM|nr:hypothetical protein EDC56_2839 [Sinobacterium caligoides]
MTALIYTLTIACSCYAVLCGLIFFKQKAILFPGAINDPVIMRGTTYQPIFITANNNRLAGYQRSFQHSDNDAPTILYFGGNAEPSSHMLYHARELEVNEFYIFDYRGYGQSSGTTSEATLFSDAEAIIDQLLAQGVAPSQLVIMGRSLGTAVAVHAAIYLQSKQPIHIRGLLLITPFTSMADVASHHYPWLPVNMLLNQKFNTLAAIDSNTVPLPPTLFMIAGNDKVTTTASAESLYQHWPGKKDRAVYHQATHNTIDQQDEYYPAINQWLGQLKP